MRLLKWKNIIFGVDMVPGKIPCSLVLFDQFWNLMVNGLIENDSIRVDPYNGIQVEHCHLGYRIPPE